MLPTRVKKIEIDFFVYEIFRPSLLYFKLQTSDQTSEIKFFKLFAFYLQEKEEKVRIRKEEEDRKNKIELEKFDRKMHITKKKRKNREMEEDDQESSNTVFYAIFLFTVSIVSLGAFIYYQIFLI